MPTYLITLALGPVQSLIAAARRTRDLWCGSWLLSEAARAAARVLHQHEPGCLIFPAPEHPDTELLPQDKPGDAANIANIIRAVLPLSNTEAVRALCAQAKQAAVLRLRELGDEARQELPGGGLRNEVWNAQIDDILEIFAAWVELPEGTTYTDKNQQLGGVLAARKATRDFAACPELATPDLPKSSLDGALETVLPEWREKHRARRQLGLSDGEQLDALGLMKRLAGDSEQFTAYTRIAADSWLRDLMPDQLARLCAAYEPLVGLELATRVRGNQGVYRDFPYDGGLLFDFRLANALSTERYDSEAVAALTQLKSTLAALCREHDQFGAKIDAPVPYAALLLADGDRMGKLLTQAQTPQDSRHISQALHGFASSVREITRQHHGHAIYAGGDDVLALLPLNQAVACSRALAEAFQAALADVAKNLGLAATDWPTLSVGLGLGHIIEPFWRLRDRAERAEKLAKGNGLPEAQQRNALQIILGIRSGGELAWRAQWSEQAAFEALQKFIAAFAQDQLPSRVAYDLRAIDLRLAWLREDKTHTANGMREAEVTRMLDRARAQGQKISPELRALLLAQAKNQALAKLADTLIIARWLAARSQHALGERG